MRDAAIAAALAGEAERGTRKTIPSGWRNNLSMDQQATFGEEEPFTIGYRRCRDGSWLFSMPGEQTVHARRFSTDKAWMDVEVDGHRFRVRYSSVASGEDRLWEITVPHGHASVMERARFAQPEPPAVPGATCAPMHGMVCHVAVEAGDEVSEGQLLCIVEAMKMEHQLLAPYAGVVASVSVQQGEQVETDQVLVVVDKNEGEQ